jgi:hypothetical protein
MGTLLSVQQEREHISKKYTTMNAHSYTFSHACSYRRCGPSIQCELIPQTSQPFLGAGKSQNTSPAQIPYVSSLHIFLK